jgi:hypothetical protein
MGFGREVMGRGGKEREKERDQNEAHVLGDGI